MAKCERWREVPGYPEYLVSDLGRVAHIRMLEPNKNTRYSTTTMLPPGGHRRGNGKRQSKRVLVHRLVLTAFKRMPKDGEIGRHLDDDRANNALSNLAWGTKRHNAEDARRNGVMAIGSRVGGAKITEAQAREIIRRQPKEGSKKLAAEFGLSREHVSGIAHGRFWRHLSQQ